jgi:hypothetical protein
MKQQVCKLKPLQLPLACLIKQAIRGSISSTTREVVSNYSNIAKAFEQEELAMRLAAVWAHEMQLQQLPPFELIRLRFGGYRSQWD